MISMSCVDFVNQAPGLALIKSTNSEIIASSPAMAKLLGFISPDETVGLTDFDLRCDASMGAEQFIYQDKVAMKKGYNKAIDIYNYSNGALKIIFHEKKAIKIDNEIIGLSFVGYDIVYSHKLTSQLLSLMEQDCSFLSVEQKNHASYIFHKTYPRSKLSQKESLCLYYILRNKSNSEIAALMHLSCRTIEGKVNVIKEKLSCHSRRQLIEKSINEGYLHIIINQLFKKGGYSINLT